MYIHPKGSSFKTTKVIGVRRGKLYRLYFEPARALIDSNMDPCELWNKRMTQLHHGTLKVLRDILPILPNFSTSRRDVCKGCALEKYAKTIFLGSDSRFKGIFNMVHSNICGLVSTTSSMGYNYYITFIDDLSRKTWIYFMKTKDNVFSQFQ